MESDGESSYLRPCPVCRVTMVGEKSTPHQRHPDLYRCLNCGAVVDFTDKTPPDPAEE